MTTHHKDIKQIEEIREIVAYYGVAIGVADDKPIKLAQAMVGDPFQEATQAIEQLLVRARIKELKKHGDQWRAWLDDTKNVKLEDVVNWYDLRIAELEKELKI